MKIREKRKTWLRDMFRIWRKVRFVYLYQSCNEDFDTTVGDDVCSVDEGDDSRNDTS